MTPQAENTKNDAVDDLAAIIRPTVATQFGCTDSCHAHEGLVEDTARAVLTAGFRRVPEGMTAEKLLRMADVFDDADIPRRNQELDSFSADLRAWAVALSDSPETKDTHNER